MSYKGILTFIPVPVPPLPEPFLSGDPLAIYQYEQDPNNIKNFDVLQQMINTETVFSGNKLAAAKIGAYNGAVTRYYENGGAANTYGFTLPASLPVLESCYRPAPDATEVYDPSTGTWKPAEPKIVIETKPWSLPKGTVLFTVQE